MASETYYVAGYDGEEIPDFSTWETTIDGAKDAGEYLVKDSCSGFAEVNIYEIQVTRKFSSVVAVDWERS